MSSRAEENSIIVSTKVFRFFPYLPPPIPQFLGVQEFQSDRILYGTRVMITPLRTAQAGVIFITLFGDFSKKSASFSREL
jgi:hypothetical protein